MKKVISGALAAAIITSNLPLRVLAEEVNPIVEATTDSNQESAVERTGYIEVDINLDMPIYNNKGRNIGINVGLINGTDTFTVNGENLSGDFNIGEKTCSYTVEALGLDRSSSVGDDGKVYAYRVTFKDLPAGTGEKYKIALSGNGFSNVESDEIEIDKYSKRIVVNNAGKSENRESENESLLPIGDVNNDRKVDDADYDAVFAAIGGTSEKYDLNRDGKVNIADLQYVHNNMEIATENLKFKDAGLILDSEIIKNITPELNEGFKCDNLNEGLKNILDDSEDGTLKIESNSEKGITSENPISLGLTLTENQPEISMRYLSIVGNITNGSIIIEDGNNKKEITFDENGNIKNNSNLRKSNKHQIDNISTRENTNKRNNIVIDLEEQIAVTKITINVTGVSDDRNLAEIAKVEFLNNAYKKIPKPEISIPSITSVSTSTSTGNEHINVKWTSKDQNITGYELKVEEIDENGVQKSSEKKFRMSENEFKISNVKPYSRYRLSVQALNGAWEGGYKTADDNDEKGVIDNVVAESIATGKYELKTFDQDGIVNIMVIPDDVPKHPEGIKTEGGYKEIKVSWKSHNAAKSFDVYYREKGSSGDFIKANGETKVTGTSYTIKNLKDDTTYEIKLTATNHHGEGGFSPIVSAKTIDMGIPRTQNYKLINTVSKNNSDKTNHIASVEYPESKSIKVTTTSNYAVVDNNYNSYWEIDGLDAGIAGNVENLGPKVSFDKEYTIDKIAVVSKLDGTGMTTNFAEVRVYNADDSFVKEYVPTFSNHIDKGVYTMLKFNEPVTLEKGQKMQVNLRSSSGNVSITELKFYEYDSLEKEINALFDDDLYLVLKKDTTKEKVDKLKERLETMDNGEYHPDKIELEKKIERAYSLLNAEDLKDRVTKVDILINSDGVNTGYGNHWQALGLAARAGEEIKVYLSRDISDTSANRDVYLAYEQNYAESGSAISEPIKLNPGENTISIEKLVSYDEVERGGNLYVRMTGTPEERGTNIKIRVSGAEKIPHLNTNDYLEDLEGEEGISKKDLDHIDVNYLVDNKSNNNDKKVKAYKNKLREYIKELKYHVENIEEIHAKSNEKYSNYDKVKDNILPYDEKTSILNSTNIEGDRFTLTIPATQAYNGLGLKASDTEEDIDARVDKLYDTMLAWEQLIQITNAKKGVFEGKFSDMLNIDLDGVGGVGNKEDIEIYNSTYKASRQRVNIKYQRMFGGAFMYAGAHHVGVEFDSTDDLMRGVPYKFDKESGKVLNPSTDPETGEATKYGGNLFGWGISHEIGHKADIGNRTFGETSNNILALITQTFDGVSKSRLELNGIYPKIYKKVTSNSVGLTQDVATLLGMFWQLHLAYEKAPTSQMLKNNTDTDLKNDSYYAKMNRLYRNLTPTEAKMNKEQLLIVKASEAAGKDLSEFFKSWGLLAEKDTLIYLQQKYTKEEQIEKRKIQYLNDEAYRRRLKGSAFTTMEAGTEVKASFANGVKEGTIVNSSSVTLNLDVNKSRENILGYEIKRSDGNKKGGENEGTIVNYRPIGFVNANKEGITTFEDNISPINNRTVTYKVIAYDYDLNPTKEVTVGNVGNVENAGTVKLSHDGTIKSDDFILKSNMISTVGKIEESNRESTISENTTEDNSLDNIKDGNKSTAFRGRRMTSDEYSKNPHKQEGININEDPYIIMDLQGVKDISGLKYTKSSLAVSKFSLKRLFNRSTTYSPIKKYEIYVSDDGKTWGNPVASGTFEFGNKISNTILGGKDTDSDTSKVLFEKNKNLYSYDARYVKLVAKEAGDSNLDIADISLMGSTGDNIEIGGKDTNGEKITGVGRLASDYKYDDENEENIIPKGSIIVMGEYKGTPGYNIPLLIDKDNHTINGEVILTASLPEGSELGKVVEGKWIYRVKPEDYNRLSTIKAELYRYNELEGKVPKGQRLVSDTLYTYGIDINDLPEITLGNQGSTDTENYRKKSKAKENEVVVKYINTENFNFK